MSFQYITAQQLFDSSCVYPSSLPTSSLIAATTDPLSMSDVRRIFDGKRVVFAGDPSVRVIYRDMAKFLVSGHRLRLEDVKLQNGEKPTPDANDIRVRAGGRIHMPSYIDERVCQWSLSSSIHYILLPSLECEESNELLRLVKSADLIILSSAKGYMSWKIKNESFIPFSEKLNDYASNVFALCRRIVDTSLSSSFSLKPGPLFLWYTPLPLTTVLSEDEKKQFLQIVSAGENSAKKAGFRIFDQLNIALVDCGALTINQTGCFCPIGMRLMSKILSEIAAEHWQRPLRFPISTSPSPSSPMPLVVDDITDTSERLSVSYDF